jgi:YD repeat-containing protein
VPWAVTDPWPGAVQTFSYDVSGRLTGITDALSHVVTHVYDAQGELVRIVNPQDRPPAGLA